MKSIIESIQGNHQKEITEGFAEWLINEKGYSERVSKDIVSRSKRAERLLPSHGKIDKYYMFTLEQSHAFEQLSVNVRSQIRKTVQLLMEYVHREEIIRLY